MNAPKGNIFVELEIHDMDIEPRAQVRPKGAGLTHVDHLTHDLYRGRIAYGAQFYERLFGFRNLRYFDIHGEYTERDQVSRGAIPGVAA